MADAPTRTPTPARAPTGGAGHGTRRTGAAVAVLATLTVLLAMAVPALARHPFVRPVGGSPTHAVLAPGRSVDHVVEVRNRLPHPATLRLRVRHLRDRENRCAPAEARVDRTCSWRGRGELARWLAVRVTRPRPGPDRVLWTGSLRRLRHGAVLVQRLPAGARTRVRVTATLPRAAGNEVMTDAVRYDLEWGLGMRPRSRVHRTTLDLGATGAG